jgi:hypothetical protein
MTVTDRPAAKNGASRGVSFGRGQGFTETPIVTRQAVSASARSGHGNAGRAGRCVRLGL